MQIGDKVFKFSKSIVPIQKRTMYTLGLDIIKNDDVHYNGIEIHGETESDVYELRQKIITALAEHMI